MQDNGNLIESILNGDLKSVKECVSNGADINKEDEDGKTALITASVNGELEIVKYLIDNGADVSKMDIVEWASIGFLDKVKECVESGADVNINNGRALQNATRDGYLEVARYLCENGADINIKDYEGNTALDVATMYNLSEIIKYFNSHK